MGSCGWKSHSRCLKLRSTNRWRLRKWASYVEILSLVNPKVAEYRQLLESLTE
jgi:hypothetical protein